MYTIFKRDKIKKYWWEEVLNDTFFKNHNKNSKYFKLQYSHLLVILGSTISRIAYSYY